VAEEVGENAEIPCKITASVLDSPRRQTELQRAYDVTRFGEIRLLTVQRDTFCTVLLTDMQKVGGKPGQAEDNWEVWGLDEPEMEDFLMTLEAGDLLRDSLHQHCCKGKLISSTMGLHEERGNLKGAEYIYKQYATPIKHTNYIMLKYGCHEQKYFGKYLRNFTDALPGKSRPRPTNAGGPKPTSPLAAERCPETPYSHRAAPLL
ncbi:hypothetical protein KIL84_001346, partial [Mauremys mutica]